MLRGINLAIKKFEKNNNLKISEYHSVDDTASKESEKKSSKFKEDNYIGKDIFFKSISDWLSICETRNDVFYFLKLLENYQYFSRERFEKSIHSIILGVKDKGINLAKTVFVTFPSRKGTASGGDFISTTLLFRLMRIGIKENVVTDSGIASKNNKDVLSNAECFVFIDDVIGSGRTVYSSTERAVERFKKRGFIKEETRIFIAAICADDKVIKQKLQDLQCDLKLNIESIYINSVGKCLTDQHLLDAAGVNRIYYFENKIYIEDDTKEKKDFIGGFEKCELLLSFFYNTPNNTLSIFWLPTRSNKPVFRRTSFEERPRIDDCKKRKAANHIRAYLGGFFSR